MTNDPGYDPEGGARYFDELAHGEWGRLDATLRDGSVSEYI